VPHRPETEDGANREYVDLEFGNDVVLDERDNRKNSPFWRRSHASSRLDVAGIDRVPSVSLAKSQFVLWEFRVEGGDEKNFPRHFKVP
jgi:hypothetical protein